MENIHGEDITLFTAKYLMEGVQIFEAKIHYSPEPEEE